MLRSIIAAAALMLSATVSHAQIPCAPTDQLLETLLNKFDLEPVFRGQSKVPEGFAIVLTNEKTGRWAFVVVRKEMTCVLAEGIDGQKAKEGDPV